MVLSGKTFIFRQCNNIVSNKTVSLLTHCNTAKSIKMVQIVIHNIQIVTVQKNTYIDF